jgi:peptidyl-prolyl cis-trans isomerase C
MKRTLALAVFLTMFGAACRPADTVAEVGSHRVARLELDQFAKERGQAPAAALEALVGRELLAAGARDKGLDQLPEVKARVSSVTREILAQAFYDKAVASAATDEAVHARYASGQDRLRKRELHLAQIYVRIGTDERQSLAKAQGLYSQALAGARFEELARTSSEDPASAARGGDLGTVMDGQIDAPLFEEAARLGQGEITRPLRSQFGWHIFRSLQPLASVVPPFEQVRGQLAAELLREAEKDVLVRLRAQVPVKTYAPQPVRGGTP